MQMRHWFGIFLIAVFLVSHGGAGAIPHADPVHSHETGSSHHDQASAHESVEIDFVTADSSGSDEMAPHAASHSHVSVDLPDNSSPTSSYFTRLLLPRAGEASALIGSETPPLTQPPLA